MKVSDPRRQVQFAARFMDVQIPFMAHVGVTLNDREARQEFEILCFEPAGDKIVECAV